MITTATTTSNVLIVLNMPQLGTKTVKLRGEMTDV